MRFSIALIVLLFSGQLHGSEQPSGIVAPTKSLPAKVTGGKLLEIEMSLPFSLTPPPGVQQASVWESWEIFLKRKTTTPELNPGSDVLVYKIRLVRLRPDKGNKNYILTALVPNWIPSGIFTLVVKGKGFRHESRSSVEIVNPTFTFLQVGKGAEEPETTQLVEVVVSKPDARIELLFKGVPVPCSYVTWAADYRADTRKRLLQFVVANDTSSYSNKKKLELRPAEKTPSMDRQIKVQRVEDESGKTLLDWQTLEIQNGSETCKNVIWDFHDGDTTEGLRVSHRWMFKDRIEATAVCMADDGGTEEFLFQETLGDPSEFVFSCSYAPDRANSRFSAWIDVLLFLVF